MYSAEYRKVMRLMLGKILLKGMTKIGLYFGLFKSKRYSLETRPVILEALNVKLNQFH